ncbi:GNAT family N-acetyltransferase [Fluoribacter dumoffii]|uniref:Acetyltransferase (GNAT) family n=1 Tax=Fluoribacter dumoffii TaxID=463 RepID=A0A377GC06_9GAMM|nr:GNAT family N-acetyltransferase [Fluoribacter dumoffii]KTC90654.1 GNAT family acetyltransferase [Fluoribacter dumoffii NY 23]MCW8419387.1 GNAT family N-acetyltransferase [Fluoribacter dumoffii]MCW8452738.1 GNAT family N-acetyltransferase [Fluoribacter dumoffii]MCW8460012.1 GNAT family N-acetyltransferase [Fluoribacter dumoffii]MCW8483490.1 GNAT family N-acetyltransferase [Fluoribacter dumoffii]
MIRTAKVGEIGLLNQLIEQSAWELSQEDYTKEEIEGAIQSIFGVDRELVMDQTYYVIEKEGALVACGGWSKRKTLFGGDQCNSREQGFLNPKTDYAKIRAFFVHPDHARQGLGKMLLEYCEQQAWLQGFTKMEMMATLPGVKLYHSGGYQMVETEYFILPKGNKFKMLKMRKTLNKLD